MASAKSTSVFKIIKKNLYLILSIVFLSLSLVETIYLANQPQDTRNRAEEGCWAQCNCSCGKSFCADPNGGGCNVECADACGKDYKDYMNDTYKLNVPRVPANLKCPAQYYPCNVGCCGYAGNAGKRIGYDKDGKEVSWDSNTKYADLPKEIRDAIDNGLSQVGLKRLENGTIVNDLKPNAATQAALDKSPTLRAKYESGECYLLVGGSLFCSQGGYVGDPCLPNLVGGGDSCTVVGIGSTQCSEIGMIRCKCSNGVWVIGSGGQSCDNLCGGTNNVCTSCTNEGEKPKLPSKTPTPTKKPTPTATKKPTQTPTGTLKPTKTPSPTKTPTNTPTGILAPTETPTPTSKDFVYSSPVPTTPDTPIAEVTEGPSPTRIVLPVAGFEFPSQALTISGAIVTLLGILVLL